MPDNSPTQPSATQPLAQATDLLQNGRPAAAAALIADVIATQPDNTQALYLLAVCQRYMHKPDDALLTIARLQSIKPTYGRAYQEEGHAHLARNDLPAATRAFRHAVACNNSLVASWRALTTLLAKSGDDAAASEAQMQCAKLDALPEALLSVRNMTAEGRVFAAEQLCRAFLQANPKHVEGMRLLADLGVKAGVLDDAELILENAVQFEPHNVFARKDYMNVLYRRQKYQAALTQARTLRDSEPENLDYQIAFANQCVAVGDYPQALEIYAHAIREMPHNADLHLVHGHALKTIGDLEPAVAAYRRAYTARPSFGDAYWSLANLKTYRFSDAEVSAMNAAQDDGATLADDRVHLCFALGKHYEDATDYERSAHFYIRGNDLRRSQLHYDAQQMTDRLALQKQHCGVGLFAAHAGSGNPAADPIFIVGLPRAGSTLLEQILASHSQVDGTMELPNVPALAFRLSGRRRADEQPHYPANLHELDAKALREFGEAYIEDTRVHRKAAPFFIDKMPNNFRHIGLIQLMLPNATIIDARRHPLACCFSGFKQLFASGQEFTYGLREIGQYYRDYVDLMAHWDAALPGKVLRVHYEDVVADVETQVRRVLAHCGLAFEQACVDFHETERSVRTPSSEQVRQPIFTSGLAQWRHFEPWLDPLKEALGPLPQRYRQTD